MHLRALLLVGVVVVGCRSGNGAEGAVKLTVSWSGFKPGCVRVSARDAAGAGEARSTELTGKGDFTGGEATLAVYREEGWGTTLSVSVEAFEHGCQGSAVTQTFRTVTLTPGEVSEVTLSVAAEDTDQDGYVSQLTGGTDCMDADPLSHPGATELCDSRDNDCDTQVDEELGLGTSCDPGVLGCPGQLSCASDGGTSCALQADPTLYYPDEDLDSHGRADAGVLACGSPDAGYVTLGDDCDDQAPDIHPGVSELCDTLDNDCNGSVDEGFSLGTSCDPGYDCQGLVACAGDGGTECGFVTLPETWYPDDDRDSYGKADAGLLSCAPPADHINQGGDCNDGNRFTWTGARELCDGEDNDCDGVAETASDGVCPGGGESWADKSQGSSTWFGVEPWGDGGVWVVGAGGTRARMRPGEGSFSLLGSGCSDDWRTVWVDDRTGRAYLGGDLGNLGIHELDADTCTIGPPSAPDTEMRGLWGFNLANGGVDIHGVGHKNNADGRLFLWDGSASDQMVSPVSNVPFYDVHGLSPELMFAVGGPDGSPRIYRYDPGNSQWNDQNVSTSGLKDMNSVWVVHPKLAFAVGEDRGMMKWDGQSWSKVSVSNVVPSGDDFRGIIAFGHASIYVVTQQGEAYRFDGTSWTEIFTTSGSLWDIGGTSPEDLWVVGSGGRIYHWPQ